MMHIFSTVFISSLSFPVCKLLIFQWEMSNDKAKIAKGDMTCHNKPHFCFVRTNIIKIVMQSGIWPFKVKNNTCSLTNFFFFLQKICYLETLILRYVFHRNNIYSRFYDMPTDIWHGLCRIHVKCYRPLLSIMIYL